MKGSALIYDLELSAKIEAQMAVVGAFKEFGPERSEAYMILWDLVGEQDAHRHACDMEAEQDIQEEILQARYQDHQ